MESRSSETPSNDSVPQELAARLLESHFPYDVAKRRPRVFAGRLPGDLPFEVPLPDGFVLVGSVVSEQRRGRRMVEVVLDTDLPAGGARDTYRNLLSGSGWTEDLQARRPGGFVRGPRGFLISLSRVLPRSSRRLAPELRGLPACFRGDARRQSLIVSADEQRGIPTDVRLRLITGRNPATHRWRNDPEALFVMPLLAPPPRSRGLDDRENSGLLAPPFDARHSGGDYGGSGWEHDGAYSFAALETDLDLASLTAHYATQLEAAGWSRSGEGMDGLQAWNIWTFSDNENRSWVAVFTALQVPEIPRRYLLHLRADRMTDQLVD